MVIELMDDDYIISRSVLDIKWHVILNWWMLLRLVWCAIFSRNMV